MSVRRCLIALILLLTTGPALAAPAITEPQVRAFVDRQSKAWNAADVSGYFATFTPKAVFTDQALGNDNRIVPYGASTVAQAKAQARRFFAKSKVRETSVITAIAIAPDGASARVTTYEVSQISTAGKVRQVCGQGVAIIVRTPAGLRSTGQTDTIVRCRAAPIR